MQLAEEFRVLLFFGLIALVYVVAAVTVIRMLLRRFGLVSPSTSRREVFVRRLALGLAAFGILCFAYAYFIEPYWPAVTHTRIESRKLPKWSRPLRIVHISDLHSDPRPRLEERLPGIIAAEKPDIIVFTGDSINSPGGLPVFRKCMTELAKIAPTFAVRGNWDSWYWSSRDLFGGTGVRELNAESESVNINGVPVWISGVPVKQEGRIKDLLGQAPPDVFTIFLYHYPDEIEEVAAHRIDLYCAGHTHGGQVALPFYGALVTLSKFGKRYEAGLYHVGETALYVNRGIGMEGGPAPRIRFCARPEITVIEVSPA